MDIRAFDQLDSAGTLRSLTVLPGPSFCGLEGPLLQFVSALPAFACPFGVFVTPVVSLDPF